MEGPARRRYTVSVWFLPCLGGRCAWVAVEQSFGASSSIHTTCHSVGPLQLLLSLEKPLGWVFLMSLVLSVNRAKLSLRKVKDGAFPFRSTKCTGGAGQSNHAAANNAVDALLREHPNALAVVVRPRVFCKDSGRLCRSWRSVLIYKYITLLFVSCGA
jgi:hypothetical protein